MAPFFRELVDTCIPGNMITEEDQLERLLTLLENWIHVPEDVLPETLHAIRREELRATQAWRRTPSRRKRTEPA